MILFPIPAFPLADSPCTMADTEMRENSSSTLSYHFQPSTVFQKTVVTSAHFWFYAGKLLNNSSSLFILTSSQQHLQAAQAPPTFSSDGWTTYDLDQSVLGPVAEGPFRLQIQCSACQHHIKNPDKMPFLHLHAQPRAPIRSPREAPVTIPWSPSAIPSSSGPHTRGPSTTTATGSRLRSASRSWAGTAGSSIQKFSLSTTATGTAQPGTGPPPLVGIAQCCAPVPGTMRSMRITTTSDGGYSFKYETLPNIIPVECSCF